MADVNGTVKDFEELPRTPKSLASGHGHRTTPDAASPH